MILPECLWFSTVAACCLTRRNNGWYCCCGGPLGCWCAVLPPTRSCSGIMSTCARLLRRLELLATTFRCSLAARRARFRRFTFRRTQHCTDSRRVHTMAIMTPMYTSTNRSPPRDWLRRTAPAMIKDKPVSIPAMKITCRPKTRRLR